VIQWNEIWSSLFIWFMRRGIWSVAILQWNLQKHSELYHCFICNTVLLVIKWKVTLNILFILFMRRRIWSMAILQWNLQKHYKLYHCYICNTILLFSDSMKCNLESFIYLIHEKKDLIRGNFAMKSSKTLRSILLLYL
jgi:hypothetical protein